MLNTPQQLLNAGEQKTGEPITNNRLSITVLVHVYYPGSWALIQKKCTYILSRAAKIIVTTCHDDVINEIGIADNITMLKVSNKGKDIGGKMVSLAYYTRFCERTNFIIFLHDKISPQTINADYWLNKLYSIFEKEHLKRALSIFKQDKRIGIIGSDAFLKNEYIISEKRFGSHNDQILRQLIDEYALGCKKYDFIAGTIFIARAHIFENFFSTNTSLNPREKLETGNVLDLEEGTFTHSWERLLCFVAENQGYVVKGILNNSTLDKELTL